MNKEVIETIVAPMPGKIASIDVTVGQTVKPNDLILTMEAMKMLNEISCAVDGKVIDVLVSEGQFVNVNEIMVRIG